MAATTDPPLSPLAEKLHPDTIRLNLIRAGLFLIGWEMLKSEIQKKVRDFYMMDLDVGPLPACDYERKVLSLDDGPEKGKVFRASVRWLVKNDALTEAQVARVWEMLDHRNEIAHELFALLMERKRAGIDLAMLHEMRDLIAALGVFWGRIEIETNGDFDGQEIADADIKSSFSMMIDYLVAAAEDAAAGAGMHDLSEGRT